MHHPWQLRKAVFWRIWNRNQDKACTPGRENLVKSHLVSPVLKQLINYFQCLRKTAICFFFSLLFFFKTKTKTRQQQQQKQQDLFLTSDSFLLTTSAVSTEEKSINSISEKISSRQLSSSTILTFCSSVLTHKKSPLTSLFPPSIKKKNKKNPPAPLASFPWSLVTRETRYYGNSGMEKHTFSIP